MRAKQPRLGRADRIATMASGGIPARGIARTLGATPEWVDRVLTAHSEMTTAWVLFEQTRNRLVAEVSSEGGPGPTGAVRKRKPKPNTTGPRNWLPAGAARDRALGMAADLASGLTLEAIGAKHGLTRERVRQLVNKHTEEGATRIIAEARQREASAKIERQSAVKTAVLEWSKANPTRPVKQAAAELGLPHRQIIQLLGGRKTLHTTGKPTAEKRWTDQDLLVLLARFHTETGSIRGDDFEAWSVPQGGPTKQAPYIRFGGWRAALSAAGIDAGPAARHERRYSDEDLWAALVEFFAEPRERYSSTAYESWARATAGVPSFGQVRIALPGGWTQIKTPAINATANPEGLDPEWVAEVTRRRDWPSFQRTTALSAEAALQHLRDFLADTSTQSSTRLAYTKWSATNSRPISDTILAGVNLAWPEAVKAAGGTYSQPKRKPVYRGEAIAALNRFLAEHPGGRLVDYVSWAAEHPAPCLTTLNRRFGGWTAAKTAALAESAGFPNGSG